MAKRLFFLLLLVAVAAGAYLALRHREPASTPAVTTTTPTTTPVARMAVKAYFLHGNALVPVVVDLPQTRAVARAALAALLAGPPAGYTTAVPDNAKLGSVTLVGFAATAAFSAPLPSLTRTAEAQIVDTLTQFPTVQNVAITAGTSPVALTDSAGAPLGRPATAADYSDLTSQSPIFVRTPARDSTVASPVTLSGTAVVFEASFVVEIHSGGKLLSTHDDRRLCRRPRTRNLVDDAESPAGPVQLLFYEPSAEDGSHLHTTEVDLTISS